MSNVNIRRLVENIRSGTNIYTPLVELIVNAIQAIDESGTQAGSVTIEIIRTGQADMTDRLEEVDGFVVSDNGIGFTKTNRDAFDTLYTERKMVDGGKGFGRFTCLKYFDRVRVSSTFAEDNSFRDRSFEMGLDKDIIVRESVVDSKSQQTGTRIEISGIKSVKVPDKKLETISRVVVERLLPYFVDKERVCPQVLIREAKSSDTPVSLNAYLGMEGSQIVEMCLDNGTFSLSTNKEEKSFYVRVFKILAPRTDTSKVSLVAHRREVTANPLSLHIPEFSEEFYEPSGAEQGLSRGRNFIVKAYVFSDYLNETVSLERGDFRFQADNDLLEGISQADIERQAAAIVQTALGTEIAARKQRKHERIMEYVETQAPWHRTLGHEVDFGGLPMNPSDQEIELYFQAQKYSKEVTTRRQVAAILSSNSPNELSEKITNVIDSVSDSSKNDLIHYVSMRKCVLDLFSKSFELGTDGEYNSEGEVHDIIMRRRRDSNDLDYNAHNLWILDERLNFSSYVSSDKPIGRLKGDRTDVTIFNRRMAFRGENEASNPITIFEFKKPQRDDFADPSSRDDPIQQIVRYVNQIKEGKYKTPKGRDIHVNTTTPFYGYVVCDLTPKVKKWLEFEREFTTMPDGLGWFRWFGNNSLYMEVISWTKLLRDAEMRNKIFFNKLGID